MAIKPLTALGGTARIGGLDRPDEDQEKEVDSILGAIGRKSLSGLAKVGNFLDLPGSMVRDVLGGQNPFDQILSPFSHENRTTGRELLRKAGVVGDDDTYGNFWGGIGAEILMDPLTYLTFGASAATKAGDVARKAGVLDSAVRKAVGTTKAPPLVQGLTDIFKGKDLGIIGPRTARTNLTLGDVAAQSPLTRQAIEATPGGTNALATLSTEKIGTLGRFAGQNFGGSGKTAQVMDLLGNKIRYSPPIRHLSKLFSSEVGGFASEVGQKTGAIAKDAERIALSSARERVSPIIEKLQNVSAEESDHLYRYLEGVAPSTPGVPLPGRLGSLEAPLNDLKSFVEDIRAEELSAGLPSHALDDVVEYFPRARKFFDNDLSRKTGSGGAERPLLDTGNVHQIQRTMRDMPGGVAFLNRLSLDDKFSGVYHKENWNRAPDQAFINKHLPGYKGTIPGTQKDVLYQRFLREYHNDLPGTQILKQQQAILDMQARARAIANDPSLAAPSGPFASSGIDPALIETLDTRNWASEANDANRALFNFVTRLDPRHVKEGIPAYLTNPAEALVARLERGKRAAAASTSIQDFLGQHARLVDDIEGEYVPLTDVLQKAGVTGPRAFESMARHVDQGTVKRFEEFMANKVQEVQGYKRGATPDDIMVGTLRVPKDIADDVTRYMKEFTSKDNESLNFLDKATNLFKGYVTSVWPAFHGRNFLSGQYQNWMGGAYGKTGRMFPQLFDDTKKLFQGKEIKGASEFVGEGLSDKEATQQIARWMYAHNVVGNQGYVSDIVADFSTPAIERIPGAIPQRQALENITDTLKGKPPLEKMGWKERLNPLNTRGVRRDTDTSIVSAIGSDIGARTENLNRAMPFIGFLKQGFSPAEAAKRVKALQVDYSRLTSFERNIMRRAFPFYSFTRNIIPYHIEQLIQNPGGKFAQTIRAANRARNPDKLTPDYVAESAAVPLGQGKDGGDQYLTGFGLMMEDPLSFAGGEGIGGTLRSGGLEAVSRLNPLAKAPLEWATGQSFFQKGPQGGRPLDDLDPTVGRTLSNVGQYLTGTTGQRVDPVKLPEGAEFVLANSPAARLLTSARKLSDPRKTVANKAINLLTGFSINNISPAAQDVILREKASDLMRDMGAMSFVRNSFSEEQILKMPPEQQAKARQLQALMKELSNRTKARKAAENSGN